MAKEEKKRIRRQFRDAVFKRDGYRCVVCGATRPLDAHHIVSRDVMPNGGYIKSNGITLCDTEHGCHYKAETAAADDPEWGIFALLKKIA